MAGRAHLIPTPTTDVNGKQTTVYRRPAAAPGVRPSLPAPSASGPQEAEQPHEAPAESYAERRARIAEGNAQWRAGNHPAYEQMRGEAMSVMPDAIGVFSGPGSFSREYAQRVAEAIRENDFAAILIAQRLADVHYLLEYSYDRLAAVGAPLPADAKGRAKADSRLWVMDIAQHLQALDLLPLYEVPRGDDLVGEPRLQAHYLASASGWAEYSKGEDPMIGVLDEHGDSADAHRLIAALREEGRDAEGIRAAFGVHRPLADGVL